MSDKVREVQLAAVGRSVQEEPGKSPPLELAGQVPQMVAADWPLLPVAPWVAVAAQALVTVVGPWPLPARARESPELLATLAPVALAVAQGVAEPLP